MLITLFIKSKWNKICNSSEQNSQLTMEVRSSIYQILVQYLTLYTAIQTLFLVSVVHSSEDYYDLLGVDRQASIREIRRSFKKLALQLHPDKNKGDPTAHDKFLKINRAYEVLKDGDLRKKYDMYGEEGLKEDNQWGHHYESWNFYNQEFGIYDDDKEIITLSKIDFDQLVENTEDIWFVNFYSPGCSHCHTLAPTWREVARELEGVVRIGAVNCGEDWVLCQEQGIQGYPSLMMYPRRQKYFGDRSKASLVAHALQEVDASVHHLNNGNFKWVVGESDESLPWLITFCGDGGDCLKEKSCFKLAAILKGLTNIGSVDCHKDAALCEQMGVEHGTFFYEAGNVKKGKATEITTLDIKEITDKVLSKLPEVQEVDSDFFASIMRKLKSGARPWLILFTNGDSSDLELRKLPAILSSINVGRVDCRSNQAVCKEYHIKKFPTFAIFKKGGGFEIHHGRQGAHDVAAFAKGSAATNVRVLGPADFPAVASNDEPWFIDFFAPWCPPCMKLLPEFRKAARSMGDKINFGTVDCTVHKQLCQMYNIRNYPTTIFYNQSHPHQFHGGFHQSEAIVEFIEDILKPPVLSLTPDMFNTLVKNKPKSDIWVVDFFNPHCGPCQQLAPIWRQLAKNLVDTKEVHVAQVDCLAHRDFCRRQGIRGYPSIRLYKPGKTDIYKFETFDEWFAGEDHIQYWVLSFLPTVAEELTHESFYNKVINSNEAWIVDFYTPWCGHCQVYAPEFEKIAGEVEGRVRAGKLDCQDYYHICQQAGIGAYPTVRFYSAKNRNVYGEAIENRNRNYVLNFLDKRVPKKKKVPTATLR